MFNNALIAIKRSNMSSIENLWYLFDWVVFAMDPQSHFFTQFVTALQSELLNIPVNTVRKLINLILARHAVVRSPKEGYSSSTFFKYIITYIQLFILMWLDCVYATDSQLFKSALLSFVFTEIPKMTLRKSNKQNLFYTILT